MLSRTIKKWLTVAALLGCGLALAQSEPTLNQVYEAANAGKLEQAQVMMQQVLVAHPDSGKAHFVQAELSARQGKMSRARDELALADKLAPGLPFAKSSAVQNLRAQLTAKGSTESVNKAASLATSARSTAPAAPVMAASSFPWGLALALGGGAMALVIFLTRKKAQAPVQAQSYAPPAYAQGSGLSGPQTFGAASTGAGPGASPAYGQPAYGQAAGSGLGGRVMGGLATGLAVGAGVMAAQAIGKNLMGNNENPAHPPAAAGNGTESHEPFAGNSDLGGQNFGVSDAGSWDDAGTDVAGGIDGGGDWDS